jgi:hypothetical protein
MLKDAHLQGRIYLRIMHDNAAPHFLLAVWEFLSEMFLEQWVGQCVPTVWPARFPDISPLEFISGDI